MYIIYDIIYNTKKRPTSRGQNGCARPAVLPLPLDPAAQKEVGVLLDTLTINSINAGRTFAPGRVVAAIGFIIAAAGTTGITAAAVIIAGRGIVGVFVV